jgi:hypothetical protein
METFSDLLTLRWDVSVYKSVLGVKHVGG